MRFSWIDKSLRMWTQRWLNLSIGWNKIHLNSEPNICVKKRCNFKRKRRILSFRPTKWTCLFPRHVKGWWTESSKTMLRSNNKKKKSLMFAKWLRPIRGTSKILKTTWKIKRKMVAKTCRSMKFFTKKKKKLTITWKSLNKNKKAILNKSKMLRILLKLCSCICRKLWHAKKSYLHNKP